MQKNLPYCNVYIFIASAAVGQIMEASNTYGISVNCRKNLNNRRETDAKNLNEKFSGQGPFKANFHDKFQSVENQELINDKKKASI